ncbi:MAG: AMP-binding protein, partial [Aridibacter sp.]
MPSEVNKEIIRRVKRIPLFTGEPQTLADLFYFALENHSRKDALNYKRDGEWHSIPTKEFIERGENIALGLYSLGIKTGERAAILASNSPEWTLADAGCQFAGIIDAPIYTTLTPSSVKYILNDSEAKVFFVQNVEKFERLEEIIPECKTLEKLVFFGSEKIDSE